MNVRLPNPCPEGLLSLEQCLAGRRSIRSFSSQPVSLPEISQLLWAAQGITSPEGFRTAPSAGALYPLTIYTVAGNVDGLTAGIYRYSPDRHELIAIGDGDRRKDLARAALGQESISDAPVSLVITAVYEKTTWKYGQRGIQYVHQDTGHAAQNICLQTAALKLGTVPIGAFKDTDVSDVLALQYDEVPLYILPVGRIQT